MKVEFKDGKVVIDGIETFPYWGLIKNKNPPKGLKSVKQAKSVKDASEFIPRWEGWGLQGDRNGRVYGNSGYP